MSKNITTRLSRDTTYKKKNNSYQNNLSPNEIKKKLEEYQQVDSIYDVDLNTHLRYFTLDKNGKKQFRLGGFLTKINKENKYVILSNGKLSWSVQIEDSIFFKKVSFSELKEEIIEKATKKYISKIKALEEENIKLKRTLKEVKLHIKNKNK
jgi:hypothetical protein